MARQGHLNVEVDIERIFEQAAPPVEPVARGEWAYVSMPSVIQPPLPFEEAMFQTSDAIGNGGSLLLMGYVELTPATAQARPLEIRDHSGEIVRIKERDQAYHLTHVHLLEKDGTPYFEDTSDLTLNPDSDTFTIELAPIEAVKS